MTAGVSFEIRESGKQYAVICMCCDVCYSVSTVKGSTGLCDDCLEEKYGND